MAMFKAFKPSGMEKIARSMGYQGDMQGFQDYLATNPAQQQQMDMYTNKAMQMAKGGVVKKFQTGGTVATTGVTGVTGTPIATQPQASGTGPGVTDFSVQQMYSPGVPVGGETVPVGTLYDPSQEIAQGTGTLYGQVASTAAYNNTSKYNASSNCSTCCRQRNERYSSCTS
jgi:hypothetical protein